MANQAFRDVNTVVLHGTAIQGVRTVRLSDEGEEINFNADAVAYRQDVGLTKQIAMLEIERISSNKFRDVLSAVFTAVGGTGTGTAILGRVQRARISQQGSVIRDSGDADHWIRYVGVTDINGQVEVTFRDQAQLHAAPLVKGRKGTLTLKVPVPRTAFGLPAATATETHVVTCMVKGIEKRAEHGGLGEARVVFEMYGSTNPWSKSGVTGGKQLRPVAIGGSGTVSWNAPAADAALSEATSVANAVCVGIEVDLAHGEYAQARYRFEAYSSNGTTAPIT